MMRKLGAWILLAFVAHPMGGAAQVSAWSVQTSRGWIGISVTYTTAWMGGDETTVAVIDEVVDESPAARAGVQAGDTLTHLDGRPISREVLATVGRSIEVGDLIRLTISRGGWPREILVEAAPEPPNRRILTPDAGQVVNPEGLSSQIEGAFTQSTSWTLKEQVKFNRKGVTSIDWNSYPILDLR